MKKNPVAKDLRTSKYKQRVVQSKKTYDRKADPFKALVIAINEKEKNKTEYPDSMGKGVVKGNDVAAIRDILNKK